MNAFQSSVQVLQVVPADVSAGLGLVGVGLYVGNYILITFQRIDSRGLAYFLVNIVAASCVLVSLSREFNAAAALIQMFWITLGLMAICLRVVRARAGRGQDSGADSPGLPAPCHRRARRRMLAPRRSASAELRQKAGP